MVGPEGGVNEGVFGPAFITSSNMFIYGGILAAKQIFAILGNKEYAENAGRSVIGFMRGFSLPIMRNWEDLTMAM